ncbi:MAG: hypothetical protein AB7P03_24965 [Kofleriaceae bacterium]
MTDTSPPRPRLRELLVLGSRTVWRYLGTLFSVFLVQGAIAALCMVGVWVVLANAFSHLPLFDEAVDGDLVALIWCLQYGRPSMLAVGAIVFAILVVWQAASWFLAGGLYGVIAAGPEGRNDTARCFGASGANTYLAYARLALCALPGWAVVVFVFGIALDAALPGIENALTIGELIGPVALAVLPALVLVHVLWTVSDYARVELTLRYDSHRPSAIVTYVRTIGFVLRRPITLLHGGVGWVLFALVTTAYAYLAHGHAMYGTGGAITLFLVRQGVSLLRMAIRMAIMAGQVRIGEQRPLPPLPIHHDQPS